MQYEHPGGSYRGRTGQIYIPTELKDIVEGVFGLDNRQQARPHIVLHQRPVRSHVILPNGEVIAKDIAPISYTPPQVAGFYDFPPGDGTGQCIGILEFGGGYHTEDFQAYFDELGLPMPEVKSVSVDGSQNSPGDDSQSDGEVALDIEIAGAIAPKAKIVVYFAEFTEKGWVDALSAAIHDSENMPSVISISWGFAEGQFIWTQQAINAVNNVLCEAALMGITVCCSSGDDGSNDQVNDGFAHVDFPASSPYVLTCGGTRLDASDGTISSEVVWNDGPRAQGGTTGGGLSQVFPLPNWQEEVPIPPSVNPGQLPGRGIPDVAGDADGNTGYAIRVDGQDLVFGGTSAVAPLWAGLIARINQQLGSGKTLGYFNPLLYRELGMKPKVFHDITVGNNDTAIIGGYSAGKGWDACTGWGSPDGNELLKAVQ